MSQDASLAGRVVSSSTTELLLTLITLLGLGLQSIDRKIPLSFSLSIHFHFHFNIPSPSRVNR